MHRPVALLWSVWAESVNDADHAGFARRDRRSGQTRAIRLRSAATTHQPLPTGCRRTRFSQRPDWFWRADFVPSHTPSVMLGTAEINALVAPAPPEFDYSADLAHCAIALRKAFGVSFTLWDAQTGELLHASLAAAGQQRSRSAGNWPAPFTAASRSSSPTKTACCCSRCRCRSIATARSSRRPPSSCANSVPSEHLNGAAELLGMEQAKALAWIRKQIGLAARRLLRLAAAVQAKLAAESKARQAAARSRKALRQSGLDLRRNLPAARRDAEPADQQRRRAALHAGPPLAARLPAGPRRRDSAAAGRQGRQDHVQGPHQERCCSPPASARSITTSFSAADRNPPPRSRLRAARRQPPRHRLAPTGPSRTSTS